jgi:hypothetical protein
MGDEKWGDMEKGEWVKGCRWWTDKGGGDVSTPLVLVE